MSIGRGGYNTKGKTKAQLRRDARSGALSSRRKNKKYSDVIPF
jgi:hypothetical protein